MATMVVPVAAGVAATISTVLDKALTVVAWAIAIYRHWCVDRSWHHNHRRWGDIDWRIVSGSAEHDPGNSDGNPDIDASHGRAGTE
jgi:hypothetical protein